MAEFYRKRKKICQMCAGKDVDYKNVDVMKKYRCCYPNAIYCIYIDTTKDEQEFKDYPTPQDFSKFPIKIEDSELQPDGTIKYLPHQIKPFDKEKAKKEYIERKKRLEEHMKEFYQLNNLDY